MISSLEQVSGLNSGPLDPGYGVPDYYKLGCPYDLYNVSEEGFASEGRSHVVGIRGSST